MTLASSIRVETADLSDPNIQAIVIELIDIYARDPMGSGQPLPEETKQVLGPKLAEFPGTFVPIAWDQQTPVGTAVCFQGFSTFAAKPLINIHDLMVHPDYRGKGIGRMLLHAVEQHARQLGCAKVTLEVLPSNERARHLYRDFGFDESPFADQALMFLAKPL